MTKNPTPIIKAIVKEGRETVAAAPKTGAPVRVVEPKVVPIAKAAIKKEMAAMEKQKDIKKELNREIKKEVKTVKPTPTREQEILTRKRVEEKGKELKRDLERRSEIAKKRAQEIERETRAVVKRYPLAASGLIGVGMSPIGPLVFVSRGLMG